MKEKEKSEPKIEHQAPVIQQNVRYTVSRRRKKTGDD